MKARAGVVAAVLTLLLGGLLWWGRGEHDGGIVRGHRPAESDVTSMRGAGDAPPDVDEGAVLGTLPSTRIPAGEGGRVVGPEDPDPLATLLLRVTWEEDGAPAAEVWAHVVSWGAPDPLAEGRDVVTDHQGIARVERLHAGRARVPTAASSCAASERPA